MISNNAQMICCKVYFIYYKDELLYRLTNIVSNTDVLLTESDMNTLKSIIDENQYRNIQMFYIGLLCELDHTFNFINTDVVTNLYAVTFINGIPKTCHPNLNIHDSTYNINLIDDDTGCNIQVDGLLSKQENKLIVDLVHDAYQKNKLNELQLIIVGTIENITDDSITYKYDNLFLIGSTQQFLDQLYNLTLNQK